MAALSFRLTTVFCHYSVLFQMLGLDNVICIPISKCNKGISVPCFCGLREFKVILPEKSGVKKKRKPANDVNQNDAVEPCKDSFSGNIGLISCHYRTRQTEERFSLNGSNRKRTLLKLFFIPQQGMGTCVKIVPNTFCY